MSDGILLGIVGVIAGFVVAFWVKGRIVSQKEQAAEKEAAKIIEESRHKAETLLKEAEVQTKDTLFKLKSDFEHEAKETRSELTKREARLVQKEESLDRKVEQVELREQELSRRERQAQKREQKIEARELEYTTLIDEQKRQLERICGLTAEQAKSCSSAPWKMRPVSKLPSSSKKLKTRLRRRRTRNPKKSWPPPSSVTRLIM